MSNDIFREEAVAYHSGSRSEGDLLLMLPGWTRWTYRLLLALLLASGLFVSIASVPQYAEGPAMILSDGDVAVRRFSVVALMPARHRPQLRQGMPLRLELSGYSSAYQNLTVDRIDDDVVGPHEVHRILGREAADRIPVRGPVVVVHATIPTTNFVAGGDTYQYHDAMDAVARAPLRSERILTMLRPRFRVMTESPQ